MVDQDDVQDSGEANLATLSQATVDRILGLLAPGSSLNLARLMKGSLSNFTHLVEATTPSGELVRLVVRRYSTIYRDSSQKARVEYSALHLLNAYDVPVPVPLYVDEKGTVIGGSWHRNVVSERESGGVSVITEELGHRTGRNPGEHTFDNLWGTGDRFSVGR